MLLLHRFKCDCSHQCVCVFFLTLDSGMHVVFLVGSPRAPLSSRRYYLSTGTLPSCLAIEYDVMTNSNKV